MCKESDCKSCTFFWNILCIFWTFRSLCKIFINTFSLFMLQESHCKDVFDIYGKVQLKEWTAASVKEFSMALKKVWYFFLFLLFLYTCFFLNVITWKTELYYWLALILLSGGREAWTKKNGCHNRERDVFCSHGTEEKDCWGCCFKVSIYFVCLFVYF